MMKTELRIGFAWQTLTSENLGVGALAQSQLAIARKAAERAGVSISVIEFCSTGPNRALAHELNCDVADHMSPKRMLLGQSQYLAQMRECDALLDIGEGDSFSDIYGMKRFGFLCLSKVTALMLKKPLVLSPQTIGPFKSKLAMFAAARIMSRCKKVYARDGLSMSYLKSCGLGGVADEAIDVAFRLPFTPAPKTEGERTKVGINISGLLLNGGYTKNNQFGLSVDYADLIDKVIGHFCAKPDVEVHLVAHVIAKRMPVEDDVAACMKLKEKFPNVIVAPAFTSPSQAKSYISQMDFFSGARMHACIAAFSSGVAVVPMAYSRKFNGLFNSLGYTAIADLKNESTDVAFKNITRGFENRTALKQQVDAGNQLALGKIQDYENFLTELFKRLAATKGTQHA